MDVEKLLLEVSAISKKYEMINKMTGGRIFRSIPEYEWGTLTFQGTRFLKFESRSGVIEK